MTSRLSCIVLPLSLGLATGCATDDSFDDDKPAQSDKKGGPDGKQDAYDPSNDNPATFASDLEYQLAALPREGAATVAPWPSNYWPTYLDSINHRWDGPQSQSAAAKYGAAFDVADVEDKVSRSFGIDRYRGSRTACTSAADCDADKGEDCAKREGASDGVCIPMWWGICHAWAPASIMIAEPKHEVLHNGVLFKVNDIKALLTLTWNRTYTKFVSSRCNTNGNDLTRDAYGNYRDDPACENTNAGTWHLIATNYLGIRNESFVYDRTYDDEVWNQPLRGYEITRQDEITPLQANKLTGVTPVGGTTQEARGTVANNEFYHHPAMAVSAGETFTATMTGTNDADLYVRFGAQPTATTFECRPYTTSSDERCELQVPAGATEAYVSVRGYATSSDYSLTLVAGGAMPETYVHNADAATLYRVHMTVSYVSESPASTDGNLSARIDDFTRRDYYEYVLEVDADGDVIGGVWIGDSVTRHPDFLWLPTGPRDQVVAGAIKRAQVMTLVDLSLQTPGDDGSSATELVTVQEQGTVAKDTWKHFGPFDTTDGVEVHMTGTRDADLYVRRSQAPTRTAYDCRPYRSSSTESCALTGGGTYYVSVNGWAASSDFDLTIRYTTGGTPDVPDPVDPVDTVTHLNVSDTVAQGEMKYYTLAVNAGQRVFIRSYAPHDVDLYIQLNAQPTTSAYLERAYTTSGNETIAYTPTANGTLHIGVHGWDASSFTLRTADQ